MYCPKCDGEELRMTVRKGVEIDYCPKCNGIWLDNGELKKIISQYVDQDFIREVNSKVLSNEKDDTTATASKYAAQAFMKILGLTLD